MTACSQGYNSLLLACVLLLVSQSVVAQAVVAEGNPEKASERYHSIRASIYRKQLTNYEKNGYDAKLKVRLSAALYQYNTIDEIFDSSILHFQSYGLRPSIEFGIPTKWKNITFRPSAEMAVNRQQDIGKTLYSASVTGAYDYEDLRQDSRIGAVVAMKYGTRNDEDGLNLDDYLELSVSARFRQNLKWSIRDSITTFTPFVKFSYFLDDLELGTTEELITEIEHRYEIGLNFSTLPRIRLWKLKVPEIKLSFIFGDDVTGFKIRI